ncbi:MAG: integration host factor subunit alpha [Arenicellales bacterium]|jgi:integration host factor subunit alpha|uniref:Integration host factor subunit alpha n=1 Tax=marine metagenome TaxID=408172 RepID=A0A381U2F2_9ZZZZ|nr:integration host factor subunit alpha [Arenicellales bacterium]MEC7790501.1 integration host factor subunit alpha [Pseudomonadota bacterium]MDP7618390.1 integration host factor subunit alpha [Arenicellales bacterium]MEC8888715.1 integration host factor subunit alpha [Pseudomonadota bacterium]MEC8963230.1 integration host factor subunit alpha [Pseudomonadota bacterium]|tara:strand:- start:422 stop:748 length:327 start_codon:yes stop_codon:yes gene_type:complete
MTVTKADLANTLFEQLGLNKREAKEFVELFFEKIRESLESGESVKLSGFGGFSVRDKKSRPGRNPKTGEEVPVTPRRVVTYKASQKVKDRIAKNNVSALDGKPETNQL